MDRRPISRDGLCKLRRYIYLVMELASKAITEHQDICQTVARREQLRATQSRGFIRVCDECPRLGNATLDYYRALTKVERILKRWWRLPHHLEAAPDLSTSTT